MRLTKPGVALLVPVICLLLQACGGGGGGSSSDTATAASQSPSGSTAQSGGHAVTIKDFAFSPASLTVSKGTTVNFSNQDSTNHTATSNSQGAFDTGTIGKGQSKSVTLQTPGTFSYVCSFHPFMHGSITVTP